MEYTKLGKTDLNVSRLCLGTMGFEENIAITPYRGCSKSCSS